MPVFSEFLLIAFLIYLWESGLWLPKNGIALRRAWFGNSWRVLRADRILALRELGVVPLLPFVPDFGINPCASLPLAVGSDGAIFIQIADGNFHKTSASKWEDIRFSHPHLKIGRFSARFQSPQLIKLLRNAKNRGLGPKEAIHHCWKLTLSPSRAKHVRKRWKLLTTPLRIYCPVLTGGFFIGIPSVYFSQGPVPTAIFAAWLWIIMFCISLALFHIAKRGYPEAKAEIRQDALLSLLIPFHAMRSYETTAIHAFSETHPAAMLLATGAINHKWLKSFVRKILIPLPANPGDQALSATLLPKFRQLINPEVFLEPPNRAEDPEASLHCPRCHGLFLAGVTTCSDCEGVKLEKF